FIGANLRRLCCSTVRRWREGRRCTRGAYAPGSPRLRWARQGEFLDEATLTFDNRDAHDFVRLWDKTRFARRKRRIAVRKVLRSCALSALLLPLSFPLSFLGAGSAQAQHLPPYHAPGAEGHHRHE